MAAPMHHEEAVEFIKAALPRMTNLEALIKVSLSGPDTDKPTDDIFGMNKHLTKLNLQVASDPDMYIDGRQPGPAKLLTKEEAEKVDPKDISAWIRTTPLVVRRVGCGLSDLRWAVTDPMRLTTQGDEKLTLKFGDALSGRKIVYPPTIESLGKLPEPTEDLAQVKRDLAKFGFGFVKNALSPEQIAALKKRVLEQALAEDELGYSVRDGGPTLPNQRLFNLVNKGQEFIDLLEHPLIEKIVPDFLVDSDYCLYSYTVNISRPGSEPMIFHNDQLFLDAPLKPNYPAGLNVMWFLSDVRETNGGTRVVGGSHLDGTVLKDLRDTTGSLFASGPAGTAMFFESRLWHATGPNTETSGERPVIISFFVRASLRHQENFYVTTDPEIEATMSDRVKTYLGWKATSGVNLVIGGREVEGRISAPHSVAARPVDRIGRLEPKGKIAE